MRPMDDPAQVQLTVAMISCKRKHADYDSAPRLVYHGLNLVTASYLALRLFIRLPLEPSRAISIHPPVS